MSTITPNLPNGSTLQGACVCMCVCSVFNVVAMVYRPGYESVSSSSGARRNATLDRHAGSVSASTSQATSVSPVAHTSSLSAVSTQDSASSTRTFSIGSSLRRRVSTPCNHHGHHTHHRPSSMVAMPTDHEVTQENG